MAFSLDTEIAAAWAASAGSQSSASVVPMDAIALRNMFNARMQLVDAAEPPSPSVETADYLIPVAGGEILVRWYTNMLSAPSGSAFVYYHGGGMVFGSVELCNRMVSKYVEQTGVPFLSVDYRLAPEFSGNTLVDDGLAALSWLVERAAEFGVDTARIGLIGDSGGGGVAAGVAIAARDVGITIAKQLLIYPMLDDRTVEPDPAITPFAAWTYDDNFTTWNARLGADRGTDGVSPLAAPSRLTHFAGLAPAYIDVGELDIFRDESIRYALGLVQAGVSTELYVRPGCPHGFDRAGVEVAARSWADRYRAIKSV